MKRTMWLAMAWAVMSWLVVPAQAAENERSGQAYKAETLVGKDVEDRQGQDLGEIERLVVDPRHGRIAYAVVSSGGLLGIGEKHLLVPWQAFTVSKKGDEGFKIVLQMAKDQVQRAPAFDTDNLPGTISPAYARTLFRFYDVEPYWQAGRGEEHGPGGPWMISASKLRDKEVTTKRGEEVGDIEQLIIDPFYGRLAYALIDAEIDGRDQYLLVPWEALKVEKAEERIRITLDTPRERLRDAPAYEDKGQVPAVITPAFGRQLAGFYGVTPYWTGTEDRPASVQPTGTRGERDGFPQRYDRFYQITARDGYLVGGEGDTGDSIRYDGSMIWRGPGQATVIVDDASNSGLVMGTVRTKGHTYTVIMTDFKGEKPFMDGGIATDLHLHATSGHGAPVLPRTWSPIAGWGKATVFKDDEVLYKDFKGHFMLTTGVRNESTYKVDFLDPERVEKLIMTKEDLGGSQERMKQAEVKQTMRDIEEKSAEVSPNTFQLHILAMSPEKNPKHLPPHETAIHFVFNEITWH